MGVNYAGSAINNLRIDNRVERNLAVMQMDRILRRKSLCQDRIAPTAIASQDTFRSGWALPSRHDVRQDADW
jgi:hypothetical protein